MPSTSSCKTSLTHHKKTNLVLKLPSVTIVRATRSFTWSTMLKVNVFNGDLGYITDLIPGKYTESKQDELSLILMATKVSYP